MLSIAIRIDGHFVFPVVVDAWRGGVPARGAATLALRSAGIGLSTGGTGPAAGRIRTIRVRALRLLLGMGRVRPMVDLWRACAMAVNVLKRVGTCESLLTIPTLSCHYLRL